MDDPRERFLHHVRSNNRGFRVHGSYSAHVQASLMEMMFYTIVDYINHEREMDEYGVGRLERVYSFPAAFMTCEDPRKWLDQNRPVDDLGLIMYVYDHVYEMTPGKHRRTMLYLANIVYFDL